MTNWAVKELGRAIISAAVQEVDWKEFTPAHRPRVTDPIKVYRPSGWIDSKMSEWQKDGNTYLKGSFRLRRIFLKSHNHLYTSIQRDKFKPNLHLC